MADKDTTVKVAVRIRPLNDYEAVQDSSLCVDVVPGETQIRAGANTFYTFDHVFGADSSQETIFENCVLDLLNAAFEGFNATILAYGQTGSGKTYTMGSAAEEVIAEENLGIIPRVIKNLFRMIREKEEKNSRSTYKVYVQFLEIYGEDIKDLLDQTKTSKVAIRETRSGEVFVTGAKEELVSSFEQMMKALEDGTKNRTTASTKMNQTSSRSHAIFTVNLEHIIHSEVVREQIPGECEHNESEVKEVEKVAVVTQEVQKCKFHFVDLAGSERAKRTGAQGQQLKEGIDINKGLLALGNVISALGDDQKKGKVFVPYRDSKLTRMLQDSLGGNSKTLMICCVSPAAVNYNESHNALRYANRARNIKNKPVVNRDPTVVMIDELRSSLMMLAHELLEMKRKKAYIETNPNITQQLLEDILMGNSTGASAAQGSQKQIEMPSTRTNGNTGNASVPSSNHKSSSSADIKRLKEANEKYDQQCCELNLRLKDAEFELQRLTEQLKLARQHNSEISEQVYFAQSERDFFKLKWSEACPQESQLLDRLSESLNSSLHAEHSPAASSDPSDGTGDSAMTSPTSIPCPATPLKEKTEYTKMVVQYLREIDSLKREIATERSTNIAKLANFENTELTLPAEIDTEFTSAISSLIAQTRTQLMEESRKLQLTLHESTEDDDDLLEEKGNAAHLLDDVEEEEKAFNKRQRMLNAEVVEIGQSIQLKEQLMAQLIKSQQQYTVMKSFYEQKLSVLSLAMQEKQAEREKLLAELSEISEKSNQTTVAQERESKLRADLKLKDEELMKMKKKQDELRNLTQLQSQYSRQMAKLESEIVGMKRQRVDLTKTLQQEKKSYMVNLSEKAKEIERLKKELTKASTEVKKLGRSKEIAESKAKDALREGAALKKKTQELMKLQVDVTSTAAARAAIRAISKASAKFANSKYLSEEELRVKKWIDQRISEISAREAAAEALKRQCEQQLLLLQRKEHLENEKRIAISKVANQETVEMERSDDFPPSTPNAKQSSSFNQDSPIPPTPILTSSEEEKLLELIEDRLSSIDGQLNARNQKISDIQRQINEAGDIPGSEKAVEALKKTSAGSLHGAHELIRMLFDMLIHVSKDFKVQNEQINELLEKERSHMQRIDDLQNKLAAEKRAHDVELTTINKEFEQKLQGFFHHIVPDNSGNHAHAHSDSEGEESEQHGFAESHSLSQPQVLDFGSPSAKMLRRTASYDATAIQLALSTEEGKLLKSQLEREQMKTVQYETKLSELEKIKFSLMMDIEDKNSQIKFLEEDRELFKKMAEELKAGLNTLGKDGKNVVLNAADRVSGRPTQGLFAEYLHISDEDDETESLLGEYDNIGDEIQRNGVVSHTKTSTNANEASSSSSRSNHEGDIFHRLNNPSNYTGHMRNVFNEKKNLVKRKAQDTKGSHHAGDTGKRHGSASSANAFHKKDKDHVTSVTPGVNSHHPYYSFSTTQPPWKRTSAGGEGVEETNESQSVNSSTLSIDVPEGENPEVVSPEPLPNVFDRLTAGIHRKGQNTIVPRTTSPSSGIASLRPATASDVSHDTQRLTRTSSAASMVARSASVPSTPSSSTTSANNTAGSSNKQGSGGHGNNNNNNQASSSSSPDSER